MDTLEVIGIIAISFAPFVVSAGAVVLAGGPRKWPFLSYAFSLLASLLAGKGFGLLLWSASWIIAWVFAAIALRQRGGFAHIQVERLRTNLPRDAEAPINPPDESSQLEGGSVGRRQSS